jgi:hypothetical protein
VYVVIHRGSRWKGIAEAMGTKPRENIGEYLQNLLLLQMIIWNEGSLGGSSYGNLELELAKSLNPNRREIRVPEYIRGIKDPNTTHL